MAKGIRIEDPAVARAILQRYTGNAEAQAALADLDAQEQPPAAAPTARPPRTPQSSSQARSVRKAQGTLQRDKLRAFGAGGGVAGDYRTMIKQQQLQAQEARLARVETIEREQRLQDREAAIQQRAQRPAEEARRAEEGRRSKLAERASGVYRRVVEFGQGLNTRAERIPTPGGLGSLIIALLVLTFAAVPISSNTADQTKGTSHTRLELLWLTIRGQTTLPSSAGAGTANTAPATSTSGAQTAPGTGGLAATLRARTAPVAVTQDAQLLARLPVAPGPGALEGPWTFPTRPGAAGWE